MTKWFLLVLLVLPIGACRRSTCLPAREQMRFGHSMGHRLEGALELVGDGDRPVACLRDVDDHWTGCWDIDPKTGAVEGRGLTAPHARREFRATEDRLTSSDGRHVAIVHRGPPSSIEIVDAKTGAVERTIEPQLPYQIEGLAYIGDTVFVARSFIGVGTLAPDGPTTVDGFRDDGTPLGAFGTRLHVVDDHRVTAWDDSRVVVYDTATHQRTTADGRISRDVIEILPIAGGYLAYTWNRPFGLDVLDPHDLSVRATLELPACK